MDRRADSILEPCRWSLDGREAFSGDAGGLSGHSKVGLIVGVSIKMASIHPSYSAGGAGLPALPCDRFMARIGYQIDLAMCYEC
jgi:hypothetical protein